MAAVVTDIASSRWQLPLLALAIALIVLAPVLLLREASNESLAAVELVNHTQQIEADANALAYHVRDIEAAALALAGGVDTPMLRSRLEESRQAVGPLLERMQSLTLDNPRQQVRVGMLRANIGMRLQEAERLVRAGADSGVDIEALVNRYPMRGVIAEMVADERKLLEIRRSAATSKRRSAETLRWAAMLAQLALLATLAFFLLRQQVHRVEAQGDARRASARAATVLDTVREPIVLIDAALNVVMHNVAFGELYGVSDTAVGKPLAEVGEGAWQDEEILRRFTDVLLRDRELWDFQREQQSADGVMRVMLLNARRMALPETEDGVVLVTVSDISAQHASEHQIRVLNHQLEGKIDQVSDVNRELEAFSYSVSHDLRAPLRHIAGFADKLGRQLGDEADEKSRHYIDVISGSAKRMSELIDDLLVYSRLGRSAIRLQVVDVQSMVQDTRSLLDSNMHHDYPEHAIEWTLGNLPVLVADENMLRQVWLNLLGNAVKYSMKSEPARIRISHAYDGDGNHHFQVGDNGAGFDMAYAGKLFGVFQRLHSSSEFPGTGIGLASVRRVLNRHGGRIWADARPGEGATFHFMLPANLDPPTRSDRIS